MIILIIQIIVSYDQNISLIFFMWKMDPMPGFDIRLAFTLPPRDSTLQYKRCVNLWNNFPCIITLMYTMHLCKICIYLCAICIYEHYIYVHYICVHFIYVHNVSMYTMYVQGCSEWRKGEGQGGINILERSYSCPTCTWQVI